MCLIPAQIYAEMPTTTEYFNQYFKMKIFILLNSRVLGNILTISILKWKCLSCSIAEFYKTQLAIQHDKHFQFKILVKAFRSGWHLWLQHSMRVQCKFSRFMYFSFLGFQRNTSSLLTLIINEILFDFQLIW